jgi:hypothetical protein
MEAMVSGVLRWCVTSIQSDVMVSEHATAVEWFGPFALMDAVMSGHIGALGWFVPFA